MASDISYITIDATYPIPGRDNDSQGFRTNFSLIKNGLEVAAEEISLLQANKADLIAQSVFTNLTPSYSTDTGAVVIAGGMGIGGDVYIGGILSVNGGSALTSATSIASTTTDVIMTGTFGQPVFALASTISGNKKWRGTNAFSPATNYDYAGSSSTNVFISTTATSADVVGLHTRLTSYGVALKLDMKIANVGNKYISFIKTDGSNNETELGSISLHTDGSTLYFNGGLTINGGTTINSGATINYGATINDGATINGGLKIPGSVPATSTSYGTTGQIAVDASFIYVCTGTNLWTRLALAPYQTW